MARTVIMPRFGMTQEEATIVRWIKQEGEWVESGDPICEVTTDKINMEVEAPVDGILAGLRFQEGDAVPVTQVIAYVLAEGEALPQGENLPAGESAPSSPPAAPPVVADTSPAQPVPVAERMPRATPVARRLADAQSVDLQAVEPRGPDGRITRQDVERYLASRQAQPAVEGPVRATPAARRLARRHGLDLGRIPGSGPQGRVQGWDVQGFAAQLAQAAPPPVIQPVAPPAVAQASVREEAVPALPLGEEPIAIPLEGMRRTIAQRMQASWQQIPHILLSVDIDMGPAEAMRQSFNARLGGGISMTAVLVKACAAALRQHPRLNSYFREDKILVMPQVNVGLAVALEDGLIVPVVHRADEKGLMQIGQEVGDLSRRAREGALRPEDVVDGTFTLSNLGMLGVDHFTAIINPPQVAILAVGRAARRFVPDEAGKPVARSMMTVTLSVDHRALDGAQAARFLATLRGILETAGAQWG